jgi:RimJ/RimL family protein N-acetyltransferase
MRSWAELWPPYAVRITEGDLTLAVQRDEDLPELVDLVLNGVHDPAKMPFKVPWTLENPKTLPASLVRYFSRIRADFGPQKFELVFAVRVADELVGVQALHTENFRITRTGETGSWLGRSHQGQGLGTRMRRALCAFAFDHLGAMEITSGAFLDNPASLTVSAKVGYLPNGRARLKRRDNELAVEQKLVLTPEHFVRGEPIEVCGAAQLRSFLDLD